MARSPRDILKRIIGSLVLLTFAGGYIGVLFAGETAWVLAAPAFALMVLWGIVQQRRTASAPTSAPTRARRAHSSKRNQLAVSVLFLSGFLAFATMAFLSRSKGVPDIGNSGLLSPREHYTFSDHGIQREGERWRFVTVGLIFTTWWFAMAIASSIHVFFRESRSGAQRDAA